MMDESRLAEIEARVKRAELSIAACNHTSVEVLLGGDIPDLLAEVRRLTKDN